VSTIGSQKIVQQFVANTFQYQDNLSWQSDKHSLKAGGLLLRYQQNVYFSGNNGQLGLFEFNGQYTRDLSNPRSIGSPIADFFLGYPSRMARGDVAGTWGHRNTLWAGFLQDDWRPTSTVTANLGLRYEYRTPLVEVHDRQVNFDLSTGQARFAGQDGNSRGLYEPFKFGFQPRVGMAWMPARWRQAVVIRGAYGISSFQEGTGTNLRLTLNPPFFNELELVNANPTVLGPALTTGFDGLRLKDPLLGTILRVWDPSLQPVRSQQWHLTIERLLGRSIALATAYVAQAGKHLVEPVNANQPSRPGDPRPLDHIYPQISAALLTTATPTNVTTPFSRRCASDSPTDGVSWVRTRGASP
jgi:hypothetical protein